MKKLAALSLMCTIGVPPARAAGHSGASPVLDPPPRVLSLERPHDDWHVVTTIVLKIQPTTTPPVQRRFRWTSPQHGELACKGNDVTKHEDVPKNYVDVLAGISSVTCTYQPAVGFAGVDTFTYDAAFFNDTNPPTL